MLWMSAPVFTIMFFFLPETSGDNILLQRAKRLRNLNKNHDFRSRYEINERGHNFHAVIRDALAKPIEIMIKDPAILFTNFYTTLIYGIYYTFFEAFILVYPRLYGFSLGETGALFISMVFACIVALIIYILYLRLYFVPRSLKGDFEARESHLLPALYAVLFVPIGLLIFGKPLYPFFCAL
jgi:DHA1 family multidrug resistance protein-like MFS transporter